MDIGKTLSNLLIGTKQSKFAGIAILIAFIAITLSVLFNQNEFSLSERLMIILSVFLFSIPSVVLGLFDLTCVSGKTTEGSLCWWYGWIIAFVIIIISVIVVFSSISSLLTYNGAVSKSVKPVVNEDESNTIAKDIIDDVPETQQAKEMPELKGHEHEPAMNNNEIFGFSGEEFSNFQ